MSVECTNAGCVSPDEYLRRLGHPEVRPGGEVEVSDGAHRVAAHHPELVDVPVRVVRLVQNGNLEQQMCIWLDRLKLFFLLILIVEYSVQKEF